MTIYFIVYTLYTIFFLILSRLVNDKQRLNHIIAITSFGVVSFLLCLRHPSMGFDLGYYTGVGYLSSFQTIQFFSLNYIFNLSSFLNYEWGYIIFNKFISFISSKQQALLIFCGLFSLIPVFYIFYKKSLSVISSFVVYLALPCFIILFSGLRQGIAIGICFFSLLFIARKKLLYFILTVCIAMLFHKSAIVFSIAYFIYHFKISNKIRLYLTIPILVLVFFLKETLFMFFASFFRQNIIIDNNGAINLFIVFVIIYIFSSVLAKKDEEINGYLNLFFLACICQCFAGLYNIAIRVGYYFMIFLTLLLPKILTNDKKIFIIMKIPIYISFILFSLYALYTTSWAMAYPYMFCWE